MKKSIFKKLSLGLAGLMAAVMMATAGASAIAYNGDDTVASPNPAFNVFTGVPSYGNESDFLRARVPANNDENDITSKYVDPLNAGACTDGQKIQLRVYVHNGASVDGNNNGSGPSVAHGTKVKVNLPQDKGVAFDPSATISSTNAGTVNDTVNILCNGQPVTLQYIAGSARQTTKHTGTTPLSDSIVTTGAPISSEGVAGDVWGCWDERVYVVLTVKVVVPPVQPPASATCDMFDITAEDRTVKVSNFKTTMNNATFSKAVINWGEQGSADTTVTDSSKVVGQTHTYGKEGSYLINILVTFTNNTNGQTITSGGAQSSCAKMVNFLPNQPPTVTPPTTTVSTRPSTLVNTGAGSVMGLFAAATAAGAVAYRKLLARRLSSEV